MAEIYLNSNYTAQELDALRESGKIAFATLAEAQAYAKESDGNDTIVFTGGSYTAIADETGVTYQIDGNISVSSISTSSITVNLGSENFNSANAAITYTGNPYDEDKNLILDYGFVNIIGGTANAGGYIDGRDLHVRNEVYYNNNTVTTDKDGGELATGDEVWVNIGGATFSAVYGTNFFNYGSPQDAAGLKDLSEASQTASKNGGIAVYSGGVYDLSAPNSNDFNSMGNVVFNGASFTSTAKGNIFLERSLGTVTAYNCSVYNLTTSGVTALYLAHNSIFDTLMKVTIADSTITDIYIGSSEMTFKQGIDITLSSTTTRHFSAVSAAYTNITGDVTYTVIDSKITGSVHSYFSTTNKKYENFGQNINGNVSYSFTGSNVSTIYGGLYVNDTVSNSYNITGQVTISLKDSVVKNIYGSSERNDLCTGYNIHNGISISVNGSTVTNLYANKQADVTGDVVVNLSNSSHVDTLVGNTGYTVMVDGAAIVKDNVSGNVKLNVTGTGNTVKQLSGFEIISLDANANLRISENGTFEHTGIIQITGEMKNFNKVLDAADTTVYNNISVTSENTAYFISSGDIIAYSTAAKSQDVVYFDASLNGCTTGQMIAENVYYGVNAFNSLDASLTQMADNGTLVIAGDTEINDWTGITNVIVKNGATIKTANWDKSINLTVDLTGTTGIHQVFDFTGELYDENGKPGIDYGMVNIIGGTANAGGYISGGDLYVRNDVFYNDTNLGTDVKSGDVVWVNIDGATFKAVSGTNLFSYDANVDLWNISKVTAAGGALVCTGNYNVTGENNTKNTSGNIILNGATVSGGYFYLSRANNLHNSTYNVAVYNSEIATRTYLSFNASAFDAVMYVTISSSTMNEILLGGSNIGFKKDINITVTDSTASCLSGTAATCTKIDGSVIYNISGSTISGEVHSYFKTSDPKNATGHKIGGDVDFSFTDSKVETVYGGLMVADDANVTANTFEIGGNVKITLKNTDASAVYGSDNRQDNCTSYTVGGDITVSMDGGTVKNLYANRGADVTGNVTVNLSNGANVVTLVGNEGYSVTVDDVTTVVDNVNGDVILNISGTGNSVKNLSCFDIVSIDAAASLTVTGNFAHTGEVKITGTTTNFNKVIDAAASTVYGTISVTADGTSYFIDKGDLFAYSTAAHSQDTVYFNSEYSGKTGDKVGENAYFGVNAFNSLEAAQNAVSAEGTLNILSNLNGGTNTFENVEIQGNLFAVDDNAANVDLTISGATTQAVLGGGSSSGSKVTGNIELALTNSNVGTVYGGGYSSQTGNITLNISNTTCNKIVYGGNVTNTGSLTADTESTIGDVALTIAGGEFKSQVVGGSRVVASSSKDLDVTTNVGDVTLNVNGGSFADTVFGAGYILGNNSNQALLNVDSVTMTLADMTVTKNTHGIYAGGLAARGAKIAVGSAQTRSAGSAVNITVNSGTYTSIYGGGWAETGASVTVHGVTINVTGGEIADLYGGGNNDQSGARTYVDGDVLITISGGKVDNVHAGAKFVTSKVDGDSTVQITGAATIGNLCGLANNNFDSVVGEQILDINAALSCQSISGFDVINIAAGKDIDIASAFDLSGVKLDIAGQEAGWDVLCATELIGLAEALVTLNGQEAKWNTEGSMFASTSYTLTVTENEGKKSLIFGTITA